MIEDFADNHGLTMEVHERSPHDAVVGGWRNGEARFYAHFSNCSVMFDGCLVSMFGDGRDEVSAINDYAQRISGRRLALNAGSALRREIVAPLFDEYRGDVSNALPGVQE